MNRVTLRLALLVIGILLPTGARAFTTIVPDNYPSIQAAHDAGATTIQVRGGSYPGAVNLTHDVSIVPMPDPTTPALPFPRIVGSLTVTPSVAQGVNATVRGMRISGVVTLHDRPGPPNSGYVVVEGCRLDAGLVFEHETWAYIRHNLVTAAGIRGIGVPWVAEIFGNTVVGGIVMGGAEAGGRIDDNYVIAPGGVGIQWDDADGDVSGGANIVAASATGMQIRGGFATANEIIGPTVDGIVAPSTNPPAVWVYNNNVTNSGGRGISCSSLSFVRFNRVIGAAGHGVEVTGASDLTDNRVENALGTGIRCAAPGVVDSVARNVVLRSGGPGMDLASSGTVQFNVVGRSGGDGIRATASGPGHVMNKNTSYLNGQDGYDLTATAASISQNISHANIGIGLRLSGTATLACNDWFSNTLGATSGVAPGGTDVSVNPLFCNLPSDVVTLSAGSPLAVGPCAVVGAMPVGCAMAVAVVPGELSVRRLTVSPSPARGSVSFRFGPAGPGALLEVFDATGAVRWREPLAEGSTELSWRLVDHDGGQLPGGVYFARLTDGTARHNTRVVVAR